MEKIKKKQEGGHSFLPPPYHMATLIHDYRGIDACLCLGQNVVHNERGQTYVTDDTGEQVDYWSDIEDFLADLETHRETSEKAATATDPWPSYDTAPPPLIQEEEEDGH